MEESSTAKMNQPLQPKPDWWPECPWQEISLPSGATELEIRGIGNIEFLRHGWQSAEAAILERLKERGIEL